VGNQP